MVCVPHYLRQVADGSLSSFVRWTTIRHLCRLETLFAHIGAWASTQVPLFTARHLQTWYTHATNEIVVTVSGACVLTGFEATPGAVNVDFGKLDSVRREELAVNGQVFDIM